MNKPTAHWTLDRVAPHATEGMKAWNALQAQMIQLVEQDERGGADAREMHRAVADYDKLRTAAGCWNE